MSMDSEETTGSNLPSPEKERIRLSILLVDDEEGIRRIMEEMIRGSAVAGLGLIELIETAENGQEAFEKITQNKGKFNVVITDGEMPGMGGLDLARAIRDSGEDIAVGLMSAGLRSHDLTRQDVQTSLGKECGIVGFLRKPLGFKQVSDFMDQIKNSREQQIQQ